MPNILKVAFGVAGNKVRVPRIGYGTAPLSSAYDPANDEESVKALNRAIDLGCTFWDTADMYGIGHNERLLSRVLKERRAEVFLCSKFGITMREPQPGEKGNFNDFETGINGRPDYMRKCIEGSLERLGVDCIDLYYLHRVDKDVPVEETVAAMAELVREGKVRYLGLSNCSADDLRRANKVYPIAAVQVAYSAWVIDIETNGVLDACRELGVTVVAHTPLGRGFLTGQVRNAASFSEHDCRRKIPCFEPGNIENNLKLVDAFESMAKKRSCTPGQLALAWLLAQENNLIVIPGTRRIKCLEENFAAGQVSLSAGELKELRRHVDGF
ncbi:hypothetical protein IW140_006541 [Coemansia sp. RSA 1813]|nr:hypothetical protein EV178_006464 [Coemansia sp. RSA 1646]KAJ1764834.1 hypothetical protein LPJ74_006560 [Coemansia sp. RSA 1843]KAJ2085222.1 hypothetical protein IW138_006441 [Coemansia sp. RSA 986]KAJ2210152.1 hypothetical protein EV179_006415 [Coemansia sp. RSA 487]KAJ2561732.1 hypothetical protein IW140_006541 [Coemansia sp. RSA 1813]